MSRLNCFLDCRALVPPANGGLNNTAVKQTTEVPFYCDQLYTLFGSALLVCQADATWNDTEPLCKEGGCFKVTLCTDETSYI